MADTYTVEGHIILRDTTVNGGNLGDPGTSLTWASLGVYKHDSPNFNTTDVDEDGLLDAGVDHYIGSGNDFTGYTITSGGIEYPIFEDSFGSLNVALPQNGTTQTLIPSSGTTNIYQAEADAYLCFAAGTLIATSEGGRPVEDLAIGDPVLTADGRAVPVKWIGRQTLHKRFTSPDRFQPVRVAAGALGYGLPHRDLILTGDHALILDGFAINAAALVNGTFIDWVPRAALPERATYYHVETEAHEVILANGTPAETYVDYIGRRAFDNFAEYTELYGDERIIAEMPLPRISAARHFPAAIRDRISLARVA